VIDSAISIVQEWNSLKGRYENIEKRDRVKVELFVYDYGKVIATQDFEADIVAHTEAHDLAVLQLYYPREIEEVAPLLPTESRLRLFQPVYAVGCSLLHEPIATRGEITDLEDMIDGKVYTMMSAQIIFGNSGGAVFTSQDDTWYLIGVPSRVAVSRGSAVTHMGWFIPIERINEWISEQYLTFLVNDYDTPNECFKKRKEMLQPSSSGTNNQSRDPYDYYPKTDNNVPAIVPPEQKDKP
jgi:hypothetical protein